MEFLNSKFRVILGFWFWAATDHGLTHTLNSDLNFEDNDVNTKSASKLQAEQKHSFASPLSTLLEKNTSQQ
jgi:hypothetical protein